MTTTDWPVTATLRGSGFRTEIVAGGHAFAADEPAAVGGADSGPDPYALLLSSLAACTAMTLRMYAERKGWPLQAVVVQLRHDRRHVEDCRSCPDGRGQVSVITRKLTLEGPLDDEQRQRLSEIADKCPVHRTITGDVRVEHA